MYSIYYFLSTAVLGESAMDVESSADKEAPPTSETTSKQLRVTYETYKKIATMIVHHLRQIEGSTGLYVLDLHVNIYQILY